MTFTHLLKAAAPFHTSRRQQRGRCGCADTTSPLPGAAMNRQPVMVRNAQVQPLSVLGTEVRFLCEAHATGGAWSLMEVVLPRGSGPPLHEHDWDEGYYITAGEIEFTVGARSVLAVPGDFLYTPAGM